MAQHPGWLQRLGCQFHWQNRGYRDFQDFLDALSSRKRKQMRKEREQVAGQGIEFEWLQGHELSEAQWDFVYACYANTYAVRRQSPYLTCAFFSLLAERMPAAIRVVLAKQGTRPVAMAFSLLGGDSIYGRYWGAWRNSTACISKPASTKAWTTPSPTACNASMPVPRGAQIDSRV